VSRGGLYPGAAVEIQMTGKVWKESERDASEAPTAPLTTSTYLGEAE
jgi:hypothetical protein